MALFVLLTHEGADGAQAAASAEVQLGEQVVVSLGETAGKESEVTEADLAVEEKAVQAEMEKEEAAKEASGDPAEAEPSADAAEAEEPEKEATENTEEAEATETEAADDVDEENPEPEKVEDAAADQEEDPEKAEKAEAPEAPEEAAAAAASEKAEAPEAPEAPEANKAPAAPAPEASSVEAKAEKALAEAGGDTKKAAELAVEPIKEKAEEAVEAQKKATKIELKAQKTDAKSAIDQTDKVEEMTELEAVQHWKVKMDAEKKAADAAHMKKMLDMMAAAKQTREVRQKGLAKDVERHNGRLIEVHDALVDVDETINQISKEHDAVKAELAKRDEEDADRAEEQNLAMNKLTYGKTDNLGFTGKIAADANAIPPYVEKALAKAAKDISSAKKEKKEEKKEGDQDLGESRGGASLVTKEAYHPDMKKVARKIQKAAQAVMEDESGDTAQEMKDMAKKVHLASKAVLNIPVKLDKERIKSVAKRIQLAARVVKSDKKGGSEELKAMAHKLETAASKVTQEELSKEEVEEKAAELKNVAKKEEEKEEEESVLNSIEGQQSLDNVKVAGAVKTAIAAVVANATTQVHNAIAGVVAKAEARIRGDAGAAQLKTADSALAATKAAAKADGDLKKAGAAEAAAARASASAATAALRTIVEHASSPDTKDASKTLEKVMQVANKVLEDEGASGAVTLPAKPMVSKEEADQKIKAAVAEAKVEAKAEAKEEIEQAVETAKENTHAEDEADAEEEEEAKVEAKAEAKAEAKKEALVAEAKKEEAPFPTPVKEPKGKITPPAPSKQAKIDAEVKATNQAQKAKLKTLVKDVNAKKAAIKSKDEELKEPKEMVLTKAEQLEAKREEKSAKKLKKKALQAVEKAIENAKESAAEKVAAVSEAEAEKVKEAKKENADAATEAKEEATVVAETAKKIDLQKTEEKLAGNVVKMKGELQAAKKDATVKSEIANREAKGADFKKESAKEAVDDPVQAAEDETAAAKSAKAKVSKHLWPVPQVRLHEEKLQAALDRHTIGLNRVKAQLSKVDDAIKSASSTDNAFAKFHHQEVLKLHEKTAIEKENIQWANMRKASQARLLKERQKLSGEVKAVQSAAKPKKIAKEDKQAKKEPEGDSVEMIE